MQTELITIEEKPVIPKNWDYDESVKKTKQLIYKWKNMTKELAVELWIAREKLSVPEHERGKSKYRNNSSHIDKE